MITTETRRIAKRMTYRYYLIDSESGDFRDRNEQGRATSWAFNQRSAAVRWCQRTPATEVYDSQADTWIYFHG